MIKVRILEAGSITVHFHKGEILELSDEFYKELKLGDIKMLPISNVVGFNPVTEGK